MDVNDRYDALSKKLAGRERDLARQLEARLAALDGRLGDTAAPRPAPAPLTPRLDRLPRHAEIDLSGTRKLALFDAAMEEAFALRPRIGGSMAEYPTTYCETAREYVTPLLAPMPLSQAQRENILAQVEEAAAAGASVGILGSLGVHLPGVGSFINGWRMARGTGLSPAEFLHTEAGFGRVAATAAHEKWGHGFISELTAAGKEKQALQLGMNHLAAQLGVGGADSPGHARLEEQWEILFLTSHYVEEGFATWIARYLAETLARDHGNDGCLEHAPRFTLDAVLRALRQLDTAAHDAVARLFDGTSAASIDEVHAAMTDAIAALDALGDRLGYLLGMTAPYAVGYCLMDTIARQHGPKCVPFAVATACNITYGLETISNHDLRHYVATRPTLNVNTRLALMMFVSPGVKDDIDGFLKRVHDETAMTTP